MSRVVFLSDKGYVPEAEARVSIYDEWTMYGACVFEMTRSFNGVQFKLEEHLDRLRAGMVALEIPDPFTRRQWLVLCRDVQAKNDHGLHDEHRLMINVSRGPLGLYHQVAGLSEGPTITISDIPCSWATAGLGAAFTTGLNVAIPSVPSLPDECVPAELKHRSRAHFVRANRELGHRASGGLPTWALLTDRFGDLTEGVGANLFVVKDDVIWTPGNGVLRGISRDYVMSLTPVMEGELTGKMLAMATEAFFTATPFCLLPICQFNGTPIGAGVPGPVYKKLLTHWSKAVGVDIARQIQAWDAQGPPMTGSTPYRA